MRICRKAFALFVAIAAAGSVGAANKTLYWIGATGASFHDKTNWANADGTTATAYPAAQDTAVFTNDTALSLKASKATNIDTYRFEGNGDVTLGRDNTYTLCKASGSGGIFATGTGTYKLDYTVSAPATLGDYPIEVASGAIVYLSSYGTTTINDGANLVKRGTGSLYCGKVLKWYGGLILQEGKAWMSAGNGAITTGANTTLTVEGEAAKELYLEGEAATALSIARYAESDAAASTLTVHTKRSNGAQITLSGAAGTTTRFSGDFYNEAGTVGITLVWDPQAEATLDFVKRTYLHTYSSILVKSGTARFADGAAVSLLNGIEVATNAAFVVASDAGTFGSGTTLTVDDGGTLVVQKDYLPGSVLTWNGLVRLEAGQFPSSQSVQGVATMGETADLLIAGTATKMHYVYGNKSTTLRNYAETDDAAQTATFCVYTSSNPVLTLKGTKDTRFSAALKNSASGSYTLRWNPTGAHTLNVVKRAYASSQIGFQVAAGTLRVAEGASFKTTRGVSVSSDATLAVAADAGLDWSSTELTLASGATVSVESGVLLDVKAVTVGGTAVDAGLYSAGTASWMTGSGLVRVGAGAPVEPESVAKTWTGGGTTAALDDPANWGGETPNLTDGSLVATFPADSTVTIPAGGATCFKGFVAQGNLTLTGGALRLGSAGLATAGNCTTVTVDCAVNAYAEQTWSVGAGDRLTFTANGVIGSSWPAFVGRTLKLTWTGGSNSSVIELNASSPDLWDVNSTVVVEARADNALGSAGALFSARQQLRVVRLYGNSFANDFAADCEANTTGESLFNVMSGATVISGCVKSLSPNAIYWHFDNSSSGKASVTFRGGYSGGGNNNNTHFSPLHNGTVTFADVPFAVTRIWAGYNNFYANVFNLNVASNRTTRGVVLLCSSVLNTNVRDALYATDDGSSGVVMNPDATWNLAADQSVNVLSVRGSPRIASTSDATLTLRDDRLNTSREGETLLDDIGNRLSLRTEIVQTNAAVFAGNVSFVKAGALDLWLDGVSTTTGDLTVRGGTLVFRKGSWRNAGTVTVAGGRIRFENRAITRETDVVVTGDDTTGVIEIPAGLTVRCKSLTVNGKTITQGTVSDGVVTGGGVLVVGHIGLAIVFR